jgi:hypothetical protein
MAVLAVQPISRPGLAPAYAAAGAAGDSFDGNDGRVFLHFKNTNAATRTVTVNSVIPCDQGSDHDIAVIVPATTGDVMIGPLDPVRFGASPTFTYSANANLTVAAIRLPMQ